MSNRFKKKVAVITGAAQGIGKRVAEKMAKEKGTLVLRSWLSNSAAGFSPLSAVSGASSSTRTSY